MLWNIDGGGDRVKAKLNALLSEYGTIAIIVYFTIFFGTWAGFAAAITSGVEVEGTAGTVGLWGAAWLATKATQPLRLGAAVVLTPVVGAAWHRTPWGRRRLEARRARAREQEVATPEDAASQDAAPKDAAPREAAPRAATPKAAAVVSDGEA